MHFRRSTKMREEANKKQPGDVMNICYQCGRIVWAWFHGQGVRCDDCANKKKEVGK